MTEDAACLSRLYYAQPYCRRSIRPAPISLRLKMDQALEDAKNHLLEYYEQHHFLEVTDGSTSLPKENVFDVAVKDSVHVLPLAVVALCMSIVLPNYC